MSHDVLETDSPVDFHRFVGESLIHVEQWRSLRAWLPSDGRTFRVEVPKGIRAERLQGYGRIAKAGMSTNSVEVRLGDLWRRARPVPRIGPKLATTYVLIAGSHYEELVRLAIEEAPYGLEAIDLAYATSQAGSNRIERGLLVHGEAGRLLAHARPYGCASLECHEPRSGIMAALPIGWCPPGLQEELWPDDRDLVLRYSIEDATHSVEAAKLVRRRPLVALLSGDPKPLQTLPNPIKDAGPAPWRVIRSNRTTPPVEEESVPVVYRLRTFAPSPHDGSTLASRAVHRLGETLLRVLDECEAGHLPEIRYAAVDRPGRERWHFLIVDDASPQLLEAWIGLERFDLLRDLEPRGIRAYLSTGSRMIPPTYAMLGGQDDEGTFERIRKLLGEPQESNLVLIEDMQDPDVNVDQPLATKPRLIHIDAAKTELLHDVLPKLIRDWHNSEPLRTIDGWTSPEGVEELRTSLEQKLLSIGQDEDEELRSATMAAIEALESCARRAAEAIENAMRPVAEATGTCDRLAESLVAAEAGIAEACRALARFCADLTEPRRAWIAARTIELRDALAASAPVEGESDAAKATAERVRGELEPRIESLVNARKALEPLVPPLQSQADKARRAREDAERMRQQIEQAANEILERIRRDADTARAAQQDAAARATRVSQERDRLTNLEEEVRRQETANDVLHRQNQEMTTNLERRRSQAEQARRVLEDRRDRIIPEREKEVRQLEKELQSMRPEEIRQQHDGLGARIDELTRSLAQLLQQTADIERREQENRTLEERVAMREEQNKRRSAAAEQKNQDLRRRFIAAGDGPSTESPEAPRTGRSDPSTTTPPPQDAVPVNPTSRVPTPSLWKRLFSLGTRKGKR